MPANNNRVGTQLVTPDMPANNNRVGTQLLVTRDMRDRVRALAIVRQESVAEVYRHLIGLALTSEELSHTRQLDELDRHLAEVGGDRSEALERALKLRPMFAARRYGTPAEEAAG